MGVEAGPGAGRRRRQGEEGDCGREGRHVTHPVGRGHLHHDLRGRPAEVPAVAAHHHGAALAVAQVDGRQHALDEVGQVVALTLEEPGGPSQPPAAGRPLVLVGRRRHRQHRDGAPLHGASWPVLPRLREPEGICSPTGPPPAWRRARAPPRAAAPSAAGPRPAPSCRADRSSLCARPLAAPAEFGLYLPRKVRTRPTSSPAGAPDVPAASSPSWTYFRSVPKAPSQCQLPRSRGRLLARLARAFPGDRVSPGTPSARKQPGKGW